MSTGLFSSSDDTVVGGAGNDSITASHGSDTVDGGAGHDSIDGGTGDDVIVGGNAVEDGTSQTSILLINASFESDALGDDDYDNDVNGWVINGYAGEYDPKNSNLDNSQITGENVGWTWGEGSHLTQVTSETYSDNATYEFTLNIGDPTYNGAQNYTIEVLAGETVIGTLSGTTSDNVLEEVTVTSTVSDPALNGERIAIRINDHSSGTMVFDDVRGSVTIVTSAAVAGNDTINGGAGNDSIDGGDGDDVLTGGKSAAAENSHTSISLINASFESDTLSDNEDDDDAEGWAINGYAGEYNPKDSYLDNSQISGENVGWIYKAGSSLSQTTSEIYSDLATYEFLVDIGDPTYNEAQDYTIEILAGASVIGTFSGTTNDNVLDEVKVISSVSDPGLNGEAITFRITNNSNKELFVDNVSGTVTVVIPASAAGNDTINGGAGDDSIDGESGNDFLNGGSDDDTVSGGDGNDIIEGDSGTDTLYGGVGVDNIDGGDDADLLYGGDDGDTLRGAAAADTIYGGAGADEIRGGVNGDQLYGDGSSDTVYGGRGEDHVFGGAYSDLLYGGDHNDTVSGGSGEDLIYGGDGDDALSTGSGNDTLFGGTGHDVLTNSTGNDTLHGGTGNDDLIASNGDDLLYGGEGSDTLRGGADNDTLYGGDDKDAFIFEPGFGADTVYGGENGTDNDTLDLSALGSAVTITYTGDEQGTFSDGSGTGTFFGIERFVLSDLNDVLHADNDTLGVAIEGHAGNDLIGGSTGEDTVFGGAGNDTLTSSAGSDALFGGIGQDFFIINGGFGSDLIYGGEGGPDSDILNLSSLGSGVTVNYGGEEEGTVTNGSDSALFFEIESTVLTEHDDVLRASDYHTGISIDARGGEDSLIGSRGHDTIYAGSGNDRIDGFYGNDTIYGGDGDDRFIGQDSDHTVFGGAGRDSIRAGLFGNHVIYGGSDDDDVRGSFGNDTIFGGSGSEQFTNVGGASDLVYGGEDQDTFVLSEFDSDTFYGGEGGIDNDTLDLSNLSESVTVTYTGNETGMLARDAKSVSVFEIENIVLTEQGDTFDASKDNAGVIVDGGGGNDSITGGAGNDTITGGTGDDTFILTSGGGSDAIDDFGTGNDVIDTSKLTDVGALATNQDGNVTADEIVVSGGAGSVQVLSFPNGETIRVPDGTIDTTSKSTQFTSLVAMGVPPCFAPGTLILTDNGECPVEKLKVGMRVLTADHGPQVLRWIGRREVDFTDANNTRASLDIPVLIKSGSLGSELPTQDLVVSPLHRVVLSGRNVQSFFVWEEVLVQAKALCAQKQIRLMRGKRSIIYFALLFDRHEIIFANSTPVESFRPGPVAMAGFEEHVKEEIYALYPRLRSEPLEGLGQPARPIVRRRLAVEFIKACGKDSLIQVNHHHGSMLDDA